jgi:hypothetical protein
METITTKPDPTWMDPDIKRYNKKHSSSIALYRCNRFILLLVVAYLWCNASDHHCFLALHQSAVSSNWLEFCGVVPSVASSLPKGLSTLILPDMNG